MSLEQSKQNRKTITTLKVNGHRVTTIEESLDAEVKFYEDLYSTRREHNDNEEYLKNIHLDHKLSEEEANVCEGPITLKECFYALHGMK